MGKQKRSIKAQARALNERLFDELGLVDDGELCLLLRPSARLASSDLEVTGVSRLPDGSLVVHTLDDAYGLLEGQLMDQEQELVRSHGDRRGVLAFPDTCLEAVRACRDYDAAVSCVGERGRWLVSPATLRKYSGRL